MFQLILFLIAVGYFIYKLATDKPVPPNSRIDWEAEDHDRQAGMSWDERQKKWKRNEYWTTKPKEKPVEVIPKVVDYKRYLKDKEQLGETYAERRRDFGEYMHIREL